MAKLPETTPTVRYGFYRPHNRVYAPHSDELMTKQSFKAECDIHNIIKQYQRTGVIQHIAAKQASFLNLPDPLDFQQSLSLVMQAEDSFADLPASVRDRFGNDPQRFLAAFQDPAMEKELRELGLILPAPAPRPPDPQTAPASPPSPPPAPTE